MATGPHEPPHGAWGEPGHNPPPQYGAPPPYQQRRTPQPATVGIRLAARIVDYILITIVMVIITWLLSVLGSYVLTALVEAFLAFAYFVAFDVKKGWTPGKKMFELQVVGRNGGNPTLQESAVREVFTVLTIIPYIGGLLWLIAAIVIGVTINSSPTSQGKHDEMAGGTYVVRL